MTTNWTQEKIAIVGLSCLFPGANNPAEFWRNLINGVNGTSTATAAQFGADPATYYDPQRRTRDTTYSLRGGFVQSPPEIPPGLERAAGWSWVVARQALHDSGHLDRPEALARCGLILGDLSFPTQETHQLIAPIYDAALGPAIGELLGVDDLRLVREPSPNGPDHLPPSPAAVVADMLGLGAAHFCIDAACASSLYAVGLACAYLALGEADLMLAGAVSAADPLFVNMGFTHFGAYPDSAESRPLDTHSGGLVSGEGAGLVVLRRYSDAVRDGDRIHAVISGIGLANDGRGKHPLTPNPRGQIMAFQRAYQAGVDPSSVQYIECHASGTPLGDKTELQSMDEFFTSGPAPLIGSVKANNGHLLTVAGLASMLKVILSMEHGQIPATIGVENPLTSQRFGAQQIVRQNTPWTEPHKTAGVNAFGFGGVSAHLVLQNPAAAAQTSQPAPHTERARLAITGMDVQFGGCDGLDAFAQTLYDGQQHFGPLPPRRWKGLAGDGPEGAPEGAYIESFDIDFMRFKFPPKADDQPTPQHLLLLKVADKAVQDAQLAENSHVAVIVVLDTDLSLHQYRGRLDLSWQIDASLKQRGLHLEHEDRLDLEHVVKDAISPPAQVNQYTSYIGNIVSSRVSALWNFSGSAFTLSSGDNGVYKALEVAQMLLSDTDLDAVVIGAVDFAGSVEHTLTRQRQHPLNQGAATLSFDREANGWQIGEGAGALVLRRAADLNGQPAYAILESVALRPGIDQNAVAQAAEQALARAGISAQDVGCVEANASGIAPQDRAEVAGLNRIYRASADEPQTALGSVRANIGHTGAAAGIASLIKAALCVQRRFIPATPNWTAPKESPAWEGSAFYVPAESRTWFSQPGKARYAAVSGLSEDGTAAHVILSDDYQPAPAQPLSSDYLRRRDLRLFPVDADDADTLLHRLRQLETRVSNGQPLASLAAQTFAAYRSGRFAVVIVGDSHQTLLREIELALRGIPQAFESGDDWQTPGGSAFSPNPLGARGGVAFVFPGAFNTYPGVGRDWLHMFPEALDYVITRSSNVGDQIAETLLYPRYLNAPGRADFRPQRERLANDPLAMMESGTMLAVLYTHVMREVFGLKPNMAFGYSLGEGSMLWAMDVWRNGDQARAFLLRSLLFRSRLFGRKDAVREAWGLPAQAGDDFWVSHVLSASPEAVYEHLSHETRVYLTHINTPSEVVIAGDPTACERVIQRIGCPSVRAPFDTVIHNEAILSEYDAFYHLHHWPVYHVNDNVTFYSAADYEPIRLDQDLIARSIARVSCKQVNFPRLIHRAYRDGARVFIELGPGVTCSRWISDTLRAEGREHLAVAVDHLRRDDHTALLKTLARLVSHRVPLDLSSLYSDDTAAEITGKNLMRTITLGGEPVRDVILSEENRRRFGSVRLSKVAASGARQQTSAPVATAPPPVREESPAPAERPIRDEYATLDDHAARLEQRLAGLRDLEASLRQHVSDPGSAPVPPAPVQPAPPTPSVQAPVPQVRYTPRPAVFDTERIDQFARKSIKACFGEEYAIYDNRRAPRIPNTDLMLLSRIVKVDAERLVTRTGSSMTAEYDVPVNAWFYRDNPYPFAPYSMLMEMALQPCGFLSAYMGPTLDFPEIDFYFRNLDGQAYLRRDVDLRGRTLVNRVELVSSTILQGIIIQKYTFDMRLDDEPFYTGNSTFGYFTLQALSSQAGLDMGKPPARWHEANPSAPLTRVPGNRGGARPLQPGTFMRLPVDQLAFLDDVQMNASGGREGQGYIWATANVHPSDWYFACHFHEDPVMPGSLGLETVSQAIQAYALETGLGAQFHAPRFGLIEDHETVWKYRGQVLSDSANVHVEVHITRVETTADAVHIYADASLWKGALRIYEFKNVGLRLLEART